ncbi:MAG: thiamine pyrophosphate-dependent enzyme, partial [Chloroflexota bacterium]
PLSGMRFRQLGNSQCAVISTYDSFLRALPNEMKSPDVIVRFGDVPTSKALNTLMAGATEATIVTVSRDGVWNDDAHRTNHRLQLRQVRHLLPLATPKPKRVGESTWLLSWIDAENIARSHVQFANGEALFDGAVVAKIFKHLLDATTENNAPNLFVGNSSPVRHLEQFTEWWLSTINVYASRGASGIDGQVSTALGIGAVTGEHIYAILGDITFYHDMNGLLAVHRNNVSATFVVINNNGGGIFERLPIRDFEPYHTQHFLTPHGLTFENAAAMYGLEYAHVHDFDTLDTALDQYMKPGVNAIIEVQTDIKTDDACRQEIIRAVQSEIQAKFGA